jgi:hypothetical protein
MVNHHEGRVCFKGWHQPAKQKRCCRRSRQLSQNERWRVGRSYPCERIARRPRERHGRIRKRRRRGEPVCAGNIRPDRERHRGRTTTFRRATRSADEMPHVFATIRATGLMTEEAKILRTALVTSFFTVCTVFFIEWVKARLQRGRVRKWLYREMLYNCGALSAWVHSAKPHPEMQEHTAAQFASGYRKLAYELAVKERGSIRCEGTSYTGSTKFTVSLSGSAMVPTRMQKTVFCGRKLHPQPCCMGCKTDF